MGEEPTWRVSLVRVPDVRPTTSCAKVEDGEEVGRGEEDERALHPAQRASIRCASIRRSASIATQARSAPIRRHRLIPAASSVCAQSKSREGDRLRGAGRDGRRWS